MSKFSFHIFFKYTIPLEFGLKVTLRLTLESNGQNGILFLNFLFQKYLLKVILKLRL